MSQKRVLLNSLKKMKTLFTDKETQKNIDDLISKVDFLEEERSEPLTDFPLPKELKKPEEYAVFSDGACRGNPGPGSWGAMAQNSKGDILFEAASFDEDTTNNRMELLGAQKGLELLAEHLSENSINTLRMKVFLFSDSNYVVQGLNSWRHNWKKKGWKKSDGKVVDNLKYWEGLDKATNNFFNVQAIWVKGHSNHPQNERCDQLCNEILDKERF